MNKFIKGYFWPVFFAVAVFGVIDASFLTYEHFKGEVPPCAIEGCEEVLSSVYSEIMGIPISLFGVFFYLAVLLLGILFLYRKRIFFLHLLFILTALGFLVSLALVYIQIFIIEAICIYCMFSALSSTILFLLIIMLYNIQSYKFNN